ncbi:MAG TPA: hypothetical protein VIY48_06140 [Candidatus Paceibacterota bacterium]
MTKKPAKKMTLKQAERKYESSAADRKADRKGAEKLMRETNTKRKK